MSYISRHGSLQNSHCASFPGIISALSALASFSGQFLGSLHSAQLLCVTVVASFQCLTTAVVHLYFGGTSRENPRYYALLALYFT